MSKHALHKLKYILKPAGDIRINGKLVNAASPKRQPTAKKIPIHT